MTQNKKHGHISDQDLFTATISHYFKSVIFEYKQKRPK